MNISATYSLFAGIVLIVQSAFIFVPAWTRWTRNLQLVRVGIKTKGRYQGKGLVVFLLPDERPITFSTWRWSVRKTNVGDELSVLYHPTKPYLAEVLTPNALWGQPLGNLNLAIAQVLLAIFLFWNINFELAALISLVVLLCTSSLARPALHFFYPLSLLRQFAEPEPGPVMQEVGMRKSYTWQWRRWKRQLGGQGSSNAPLFLEQVEQPSAISEGETPSSLSPQEPETKRPVRGRAAREQLLHDMMSPPDSVL